MVTASKKVQYCHANPLVLSLCFLKDLVSVFCGISALEIHQVVIRHHGPFLYIEAKDFYFFFVLALPPGRVLPSGCNNNS